MTDIVERLRGERVHLLADIDIRLEAAAEIERLRAAPKVRPLEWVDLHGDGSLYQTPIDHPLGYHAVINRRGSKGWWYFGFYSTLEAAQAAAQADYERRIRVALVQGGV